MAGLDLHISGGSFLERHCRFDVIQARGETCGSSETEPPAEPERGHGDHSVAVGGSLQTGTAPGERVGEPAYHEETDADAEEDDGEVVLEVLG